MYSSNYAANSYGVRINYLLVELLNKVGIESRLLCYDSRKEGLIVPESVKAYVYYLDEEGIIIDDFDIVIYPETIDANPLAAKRVVRYLFNRPGILTGKDIKYSDSDYLVSYSKSIDARLPQLFFMSDERKDILAIKGKKKKNRVCIYFGKVDNKRLTDKVHEIVPIVKHYKKFKIITRKYPTDRSTLFDIIAESRLLISFDPLTNLCYESTLLGTPVLLADCSFLTRTGEFNIPLWGIFSSYAELVLHEDEVGRAAFEYENILNQQEGRVRTWAEDVFRHFEVIFDKPDPSYIEMNKRRIEEYRIRNQNYCPANMDPLRLDSINFVDEIDLRVLALLSPLFALKMAIIRIDLRRVARIITKKLGIYNWLRKTYRKIKFGEIESQS